MIWPYFALMLQGATPQPTLTQRQARDLTPDALAVRVLGMTGRTVREARIWGGSPPLDSFSRLGSIEFAGDPLASEGVCAAAHVQVRFAPIARDDARPDPPSMPISLETSVRWALPANPLPALATDMVAWRKAVAAEQIACRTLGAVLAEPGDSAFFSARWKSDERDVTIGEARFVAGLLRRVDRPDAAPGRTLTCELGEPDCGDPRKALADIDALRPARVEVGHCSHGAGALCIEAQYPQPPFGLWQGSYLRIRIETDALTPFVNAGITRITLSRRQWVV